MRAHQTFSTLACSLLLGSTVLAGAAAPAAQAADATFASSTASSTVASSGTNSSSNAASIKVATADALPANVSSQSAAERETLASTLDAVIDSNSKALQQLEAVTLEGMNAEVSDAATAQKASEAYDAKSAEITKANKDAYAKLAEVNGTTAATEQKRSEARLSAAADAELALATTEAPVAPDTAISPLADPFGTDTTVAGAQGASAASLGSTATISTAVSAALTKSYAKSWATTVARNNYYLYRYGYVGPRYFDCSGFTKTAMSKSQISIPRTSSMQYAGSRTKVSLSNLRIGDLIFWTSNGGSSFYHVAMYIGSGNIAHARNPTTGISVTKMNYAGMTNIYRYGVRY